jgi:hypothetical protein
MCVCAARASLLAVTNEIAGAGRDQRWPADEFVAGWWVAAQPTVTSSPRTTAATIEQSSDVESPVFLFSFSYTNLPSPSVASGGGGADSVVSRLSSSWPRVHSGQNSALRSNRWLSRWHPAKYASTDFDLSMYGCEIDYWCDSGCICLEIDYYTTTTTNRSFWTKVVLGCNVECVLNFYGFLCSSFY